MNTEYLEQECWIDTYFHENSQEKKYNLAEKPFSKDNFNYENENTGDVDLDNVFVKANLPEGLNYGDYYSYDSVWNFNNGVFDLEGILKSGEANSFYIEILGNPGDYQIKIDAGFNGTIADSAVVSVKVLDNSTPGNVTPEVPKDNNVKKLKSSVAAGDNATGNPLLMVLLVLIALALTRFRKKD